MPRKELEPVVALWAGARSVPSVPLVRMQFYVVDEEGAEQGPYSEEQVHAMIHDGLVSHDVLARLASGAMRFQRLGALLKRQADAAGTRVDSHAARAAAERAAEEDEVLPGGVSAAEVEWFYQDDVGEERGPLSTAQIRSLVRQGLLGPVRLVRRGRRGAFLDLGSWPEIAEEAELARRRPKRPAAAAGAEAEATRGGGGGGGGGEGGAGAGESPREGGEEDNEELAPPEFEDEDGLEWVYEDDRGGVQGPFSTSELQGWIREGYLQPTRRGGPAGTDAAEMQPLGRYAEFLSVVPED